MRTNVKSGNGVAGFLTNETLTKEWDQRFNRIAPVLFLTDHLSASLNEEVYTELRHAYFGQKPIDNNSIPEFIDVGPAK